MLSSLLGSSSSAKSGGSNKPGYASPVEGSRTALVTGSSGMCGARLVEMLLERGTETVICFDVAPPDDALRKRFEAATGGKNSKKKRVIICSGADGDLTSDAAVEAAFQKAERIDCCYHVGALVGPFHDRDKYYQVNTLGTVRIIDMCRKYSVPKLVYSSSPSTRFTGADVTGQTEDELPFPRRWLALYAETKAYGEMEVSKACSPPELLTVSVAPHQVYGAHDTLMLPSLLETSGNGRLRIFGTGRSLISLCWVDNYAHGMMCAADALRPDSPALGRFYIVTDGEPQLFWKIINQAGIAMGFDDLEGKFHLPVWLLYAVAYAASAIGLLTGRKFKLSPFNVRMLTMHRYFSTERAVRDLRYEPLKKFDEAWPETIEWFKVNWLPKFLEEKKKIK
jgi:nucleoside-diphosphate-sugar epimerase